MFKRENKNRPREISSKVPVSGIRNIFHVKKKVRADPRFENGFEEIQPTNRIKAEYKMKQKERDYAFIERMKQNERKQIEKSLTLGEFDDNEAAIAKKLLQKAKSREVSRQQKHLLKELDEKYSEFIKNAKQSGDKVKYMTKKDKKKAELILKFNQLKKTGKLDKYLEKKRKRNLARDGKKLSTI